MAEWKEISPGWHQRHETLPRGLTLICWRRPVGYQYRHYAYGWVRVYDGVFDELKTNGPFIEEFRLEPDSGPLELECIAHAMREKYKG